MILIRTSFLALFALLICSATFAAGEPWSDDFSPPPGKHSWVQLDTFEWIKGDIIALYSDTLVFDSDHFGDLEIELEDILNVHGRGSFAVTFANERPVRGELQIREEQVVIVAAGQRHEGSRTDLVSITPVAQRERDRWHGDIGFGTNARKGNTEIAELSIDIGFQRRTPTSRYTVEYLANMNETDGERITDNHRINTGLDRFTGRRLYWRPFSAQYFKDEFQNIRHQATLDTGLGYQLVDTKKVDWELQAGVGYNYLQNESVADGESDTDTSPVGTLGSDFTFKLTSSIEYNLLVNMTFLNEQSGRYQHHIVSALSTDLFGKHLDLDFSTIWDRTERPQESADGTTPEQDDIYFSISLVYDF
jgi:putative salt-induced outer membrane protein YdiY